MVRAEISSARQDWAPWKTGASNNRGSALPPLADEGPVVSALAPPNLLSRRRPKPPIRATRDTPPASIVADACSSGYQNLERNREIALARTQL